MIRGWASLYKSEGLTQVALLMTSFLHCYLGEVIPNPDDWANFFASYDNLYHVDELKILNSKLSLFCDLWQKIQKVIDPLHLKNHSRDKCKELYDPVNATAKYPEANMMQCEQTFAWLARYKKILIYSPKIQFHFIIHRLVTGRNKYTEKCYRDGRKPLLPSAKIAKK